MTEAWEGCLSYNPHHQPKSLTRRDNKESIIGLEGSILIITSFFFLFFSFFFFFTSSVHLGVPIVAEQVKNLT